MEGKCGGPEGQPCEWGQMLKSEGTKGHDLIDHIQVFGFRSPVANYGVVVVVVQVG